MHHGTLTLEAALYHCRSWVALEKCHSGTEDTNLLGVGRVGLLLGPSEKLATGLALKRMADSTLVKSV